MTHAQTTDGQHRPIQTTVCSALGDPVVGMVSIREVGETGSQNMQRGTLYRCPPKFQLAYTMKLGESGPAAQE